MMLTKGKIAIVPIKGIATTEGAPSFFLFPWRRVVSSTEIVEFLEETKRKRSIKAVLVEINSSGGTPFPCREIAERIKNVGKPTVACEYNSYKEILPISSLQKIANRFYCRWQ